MTMMPDVTATTGFGGFLPAKELKTGSVMDILGKDLILHHFLRKGSFVKFVYFVGLQKSGF